MFLPFVSLLPFSRLHESLSYLPGEGSLLELLHAVLFVYDISYNDM